MLAADKPKKTLKEIKQDIKNTTETLNNENLLKTFNETSQKCWNEMTKLRGSALCSICSGRGASFFINSKIMVAQEDCDNVVKECKDFFEDIQSFFKGLVKAIEVLYYTYNFGEESQRLLTFGMRLDTLKIPSIVFHKFLSYTDAPKAERPKIAAAICQNILNIRKETYLDSVADTLIPAFENLVNTSATNPGFFKEEFNNTQQHWHEHRKHHGHGCRHGCHHGHCRENKNHGREGGKKNWGDRQGGSGRHGSGGI